MNITRRFKGRHKLIAFYKKLSKIDDPLAKLVYYELVITKIFGPNYNAEEVERKLNSWSLNYDQHPIFNPQVYEHYILNKWTPVLNHNYRRYSKKRSR